jgi:hypothetical protein
MGEADQGLATASTWSAVAKRRNTPARQRGARPLRVEVPCRGDDHGSKDRGEWRKPARQPALLRSMLSIMHKSSRAFRA